MSDEIEVMLVPARVHGRILLDPHEAAEAVIVGFHGYGEDAASMLSALRRIRGSEPWSLAAIQGLHPFYRRSSGEVVASWMTRLDREQAIRDNVAYVRDALGAIVSEFGALPLAAVGFSQGCAMAWRAVEGTGFSWSALLVNGGDIPPEVGLKDWSLFPPAMILRGEEDDWYHAGRLEKDLETGQNNGHFIDSWTFPGGHEWAEVACDRSREFLGTILGNTAN